MILSCKDVNDHNYHQRQLSSYPKMSKVSVVAFQAVDTDGFGDTLGDGNYERYNRIL